MHSGWLGWGRGGVGALCHTSPQTDSSPVCLLLNQSVNSPPSSCGLYFCLPAPSAASGETPLISTDRQTGDKGLGEGKQLLAYLDFFFSFSFFYQGNNGDILSPCLSSGGGREVLKTESSECFLLLSPWARLSAANVWAASNKHESKSAFCAFVKRHWCPVSSQLKVINKGVGGADRRFPG